MFKISDYNEAKILELTNIPLNCFVKHPFNIHIKKDN